MIMTEKKVIEILFQAALAGVWDIDEAIAFFNTMPKYHYEAGILKSQKNSRVIINKQLELFLPLEGSPAYEGLLVLRKKSPLFITFFKILIENSYIEIDKADKKLVLKDELLSLRKLITYIKLVPGQPKGRRKDFWIRLDELFGYEQGRFSENSTGTDNPPQKTIKAFKELFHW